MQNSHPTIILAPQCPSGQRWVETDWSQPAHSMPRVPSVPLSLAFMLVEHIRQQYKIEPANVVVAGISMGGYGVWDLVQRHPLCFARALVVCGGGDPEAISPSLRTEMLFYHGSADNLVPVSRSRDMHARLRELDLAHQYHEIPGAGHAIWNNVFSNADVWRFLLN
jgi:predicted peptidase